jgi:pimeloyl-ACP methyl ester carboxylesterase
MRTNIKLWLVLACMMWAAPMRAQTAAAGQPTDRTVLVFGQMIHYYDVGNGPVVVLLHGLGSRKDDWMPVIEPLSQKFRLVIPDQIGFGRSDKPLLDYNVQTYVDFLSEMLRQLRVERASLVGESLGGWIAALYAAELSGGAHLVPVQKLVLVDAAGLKLDRPVPDLNPSSLAAMRTMMEAVFYDTSWLTEDALRKVFTDKLATKDSYTVRSFLSNPALGAERLDDKLGSIKAPTLVLWGKEDKLLPISLGERYAAGIVGAKIMSFEKCGHVPPVEKTEEFLGAVTAFLNAAGAK